MEARTRNHLLLSLLLFSAAVRMFFFFQLRGTDLGEIPLLDSETYHDWATRLVAGDWGWNETYWMGPLYPHFLALVYLVFGVGGPEALTIQLGMSLLNVWLVFRFTRKLLPDDAGGTALLGTALFAFYGAPVFYAGNLLMATLVTTLFLLTGLLAIRAAGKPTIGNWLVLGLMTGLTGLARGNVLLLLAGLPLLLWKAPLARPVRWKNLAALVLGGALMLAPATLRNLIVADDFVLLTSNGGVNLLIGQQHDYKGIFAPVMEEAQAEFDPSMETTLERELGRDLKGSEVSRILTRRAWHGFRDNLGAMPLHYGRKAYRFWNGYELPQIVSYDYWKTQFSALWVLPVPFVLLSALGLLGFRFLPRTARWIMIILVGSYFLSLLPFFPTSRYRQPVAPLLAVNAAVFLVAVFRGRARRWVWLPVAILLTVALLPRWAALDQAEVHWQVHLHEASRAGKRGDLDLTMAKGRQAEEVRPGLADTPFHLSLYLEDLGAHDEALAALELAQARQPASRLIPYRIGRNYEQMKKYNEALAAYERASFLDPGWAYPYLRGGLVMNLQGRKGRALDLMEKAHQRSPGNFRVRSNLASLYAESGRTELAVDILSDLTGDYPFYVNGWFNLALANFQAGNPAAAAAALDRAGALHGLTEGQKEQVRRLKLILEENPDR
ncbi:MAG: tetratricopeptide repeat protein [Candidatus Krumholzibacteriota bacterium]